MQQILTEIKKIKGSRKDLRNFGLIVGIGALVFGVLLFMFHKSSAIYLVSLSICLIISGLFFPVILRPFQKIWMSISIIMGWIMSHIILILLFYLIITPIGLLVRLFKRDFFQKRMDPSATSYWIKRECRSRKKEDYERQF